MTSRWSALVKADHISPTWIDWWFILDAALGNSVCVPMKGALCSPKYPLYGCIGISHRIDEWLIFFMVHVGKDIIHGSYVYIQLEPTKGLFQSRHFGLQVHYIRIMVHLFRLPPLTVGKCRYIQLQLHTPSCWTSKTGNQFRRARGFCMKPTTSPIAPVRIRYNV